MLDFENLFSPRPSGISLTAKCEHLDLTTQKQSPASVLVDFNTFSYRGIF
jgi:hypothetical protein